MEGIGSGVQGKKPRPTSVRPKKFSYFLPIPQKRGKRVGGSKSLVILRPRGRALKNKTEEERCPVRGFNFMDSRGSRKWRRIGCDDHKKKRRWR